MSSKRKSPRSSARRTNMLVEVALAERGDYHLTLRDEGGTFAEFPSNGLPKSLDADEKAFYRNAVQIALQKKFADEHKRKRASGGR